MECLNLNMAPASILELFEPDSDGSLDLQALDIGLRKLSQKWLAFSPEELAALMDLFDEDKNGDISYVEWNAYLRNLQRANVLKRKFLDVETPREQMDCFVADCL